MTPQPWYLNGMKEASARDSSKYDLPARMDTGRSSAADHLSKPQFYHGTNQNIPTGHTIWPGAVIGITSHEPTSHMVHVTPDPNLAREYAEERAREHGGSPHVFRVAPEGPGIRNDDAYGDAYLHPSAQVIKRERPSDHDWPTAKEWHSQERYDRKWAKIQGTPWGND